MTTRRSFRTGAILLSSILALAAAEVLLRAYSPRRTIDSVTKVYPAMFTPSETLPYRLRPSYSGPLKTGEFDTTININALGHRGKAFTAAKGDALRVLIAGDSFTFGWGVNDDETYPARLEHQLAEAIPGTRAEVINAGFAACYSPDTYYVYLKDEGLRLSPDAIVIGLYVGNDLDNAAAFENEWTETDAAGLPVRIRNLDAHVVDNLYMPRVIPRRYRVPLLSRMHLFQAMADVWWELKPRLSTVVYAQSESSVNIPFIYRHSYEERTNTVFTRVKTLLTATNALAAKAGVPLYVLVIPEDVQMNPRAFSGAAAEIDKPQRLLTEFFEAEKIRYLDLLPWLRERAAGRQIYFPGDRHWNALGHELAAERLAAFLASEISKEGSGPEK